MITVAVLKAHLGTESVKHDPDRDVVLVDLEAAAVAFVQRETGRYFGEAQTFTEYFDGHGAVELFLKESPAALTSVHERCDPGDSWVEITDSSDDGWELRGLKLLRKGGSVWEVGSEYRVIYDFGFTEGQEPADIRMLVIDLVKFWYRQRGVEGHVSGRIGDYGFTLGDLENIPGAMNTIESWQHRRVSA